MLINKIKRLLKPLQATPIHPQWLLRQRGLGAFHGRLEGLTLDIGCADGNLRHTLSDGVEYVGLDYFQTARDWYQTRPDIYADANQLPIADGAVDSVLLVHVLEHLPHPDQALAEIARVLRTGGQALVEVPFLYPVHDAPLDFRRWNSAGLAADLERHGLSVEDQASIGRGTETAAVLMNLAIARLGLDWIAKRSPWLLIAPLVWLLIPLVNLAGWALAPLQRDSDFMAHRVRLLCRKPAQES